MKKLATEKSANPYVFGLYRYLTMNIAREVGCIILCVNLCIISSFIRILGSFPVLVICTFVAERKMPIPGIKMALVRLTHCSFIS